MNCAFCQEPMHPSDTACSQCGEPLSTDVTLGPIALSFNEPGPWDGLRDRLGEWRDAVADASWPAVMVGSLALGGLALFLGLWVGRLTAGDPSSAREGLRQVPTVRALPPPPSPVLAVGTSRSDASPQPVVQEASMEWTEPPPDPPEPRVRRHVVEIPDPVAPSHTLAQERAIPTGAQRVVLLPTFPNMDVSVSVYPSRRSGP
jgi:hypothetical protein